MRILCKIGLHSWKPVLRSIPTFQLFDPERSYEIFRAGVPRVWKHSGSKCRRCDKRREVRDSALDKEGV